MNRNKLKSFLTTYYPVLVFIIIFILIFRKVLLQGLFPIPGDLLVSFFSPYSSGGWEGFVNLVSHKEFISADVIRQIYPWRILAIDLLKQGSIPLWNPYAFSGTPLLANIQTAIFYPVNILYLFLDEKIAWNISILLQPILGAFFMFLFMRSLKLSKLAGIFSGLAFGFIGYNIVWYELGVVGHTALWLPLILWGITKNSETKEQKYLLISVLGLTMSLIAGHIQTAVYVYLLSVSYYLFTQKARIVDVVVGLWIFILPMGLAAIQILPSLELLNYSARDAATSIEVFYRYQIPPQQLVMLLAPDFFGNPASRNFWGLEYDEFLCSIGVVALLFTTIAIFQNWREKRVLFFIGTAIISLVFALPTGASSLLQILNVPILGTGLPSRALFVLEFSFVVLAGIGINEIINKKISLKPLFFLASLYGVLWIIVFSGVNVFMAPSFAENIAVTKRNLILPTVLFCAASGLLFITSKRFSFRYIAVFICIFLAAFEYQYEAYRYLPYSPIAFVFPSHPLITYLQQTPPDRVYGYDGARLETNFTTQWRVLSPEGYDPLYIRRYGELMYASETGKYEKLIPRSDAVFSSSLPREDTQDKQRLMNLLGVKYLVDKTDISEKTWQPDTSRFPSERFTLSWQENKWKVYTNKAVLPRAAVFYDWQTVSDDQKAVTTLLESSFPYRSRLILPINPSMNASPGAMITQANITQYQANTVTITAVAERDGMVFLSDSYYPGWSATVDGKKAPLYRADHTFRAVPIPEGKHTIIMRYQPMSFYLGAGISVVSAMVLSVIWYSTRKNRGIRYDKKNKKA